MGRSRKRTDQMNRIKKERCAVRELARLKKILGLIDADGNEIIKKVDTITQVKKSSDIKSKKSQRKEAADALKRPVIWDVKDVIDDPDIPEEQIKVVNEKTNVEHVYNTKTLRDQFGTLPSWMNRNKTKNKVKRHMSAKKKKHDSFWTNAYVPFDD